MKSELQAIRQDLERLKKSGAIAEWELAFENKETNRKNAVFYLTPRSASDEILIWSVLLRYEDFSFTLNKDNGLSSLMYRVSFNRRDKLRNLSLPWL